MAIDRAQQLSGQIMFFQKMTKIQDACLIWECIKNTAKANKSTNAINFIDCIFHLAIREIEPVLYVVNTKHSV